MITKKIDRTANISVRFGSGFHGSAHLDMGGNRVNFKIFAIGSAGLITVNNFIHPHMDDTLEIYSDSGHTVESQGKETAHYYQLQEFLRYVNGDIPNPVPLNESVTTMKLVDQCYVMAGFDPRPSYSNGVSADVK